jgi:hypothetical protein
MNFSFDLPFAEQVAFFKQKLNLPTRRWDDIWQEQHDRSFVVAGAMEADLLDDLRRAVEKGIREGTGIDAFRKDFWNIVDKHGWVGWTGSESKARSEWRIRTIFETNLNTSYAAGRYAQLTDPDLLSVMPYWRYVHADGVLNPRPEHLAWDGLTLHHTHSFWQTHYPPNGWGCGCTVEASDAPEEGDKSEPPEGWDEQDPFTLGLPGIDEGWAYTPGKSVADELRRIVETKVAALDAPLGAAFGEVVAPRMGQPLKDNLTRFVQETASVMRAKGESALAHIISPEVIAEMAARSHPLETAGVWLTDDILLHGIRETKAARGAALPLSTWENLPALMEAAEVYLDTQDTALLYVFEGKETQTGKAEKVVIAVNYTEKTRPTGTEGKRKAVRSNYIRTGGLVDVYNIRNESRYVRLDKKGTGGGLEPHHARGKP